MPRSRSAPGRISRKKLLLEMVRVEDVLRSDNVVNEGLLLQSRSLGMAIRLGFCLVSLGFSCHGQIYVDR